MILSDELSSKVGIEQTDVIPIVRMCQYNSLLRSRRRSLRIETGSPYAPHVKAKIT